MKPKLNRQSLHIYECVRCMNEKKSAVQLVKIQHLHTATPDFRFRRLTVHIFHSAWKWELETRKKTRKEELFHMNKIGAVHSFGYVCVWTGDIVLMKGTLIVHGHHITKTIVLKTKQKRTHERHRDVPQSSTIHLEHELFITLSLCARYATATAARRVYKFQVTTAFCDEHISFFLSSSPSPCFFLAFAFFSSICFTFGIFSTQNANWIRSFRGRKQKKKTYTHLFTSDLVFLFISLSHSVAHQDGVVFTIFPRVMRLSLSLSLFFSIVKIQFYCYTHITFS